MIRLAVTSVTENIIHEFLNNSLESRQKFFDCLVSDTLDYNGNTENLKWQDSNSLYYSFDNFLEKNPEYEGIGDDILFEVKARILENSLNYTNYSLNEQCYPWAYIDIDYDFNLKDIAKEVMRHKQSLYLEDEYFIEFANDFEAIENCKTNGELADWFNDYIYNIGLTKESLYDIIKGESKDFKNVKEWIDKVEQFEYIALWVKAVANGNIDCNELIDKYSRDRLEEQFACEEYENGEVFLSICRYAQTTKTEQEGLELD